MKIVFLFQIQKKEGIHGVVKIKDVKEQREKVEKKENVQRKDVEEEDNYYLKMINNN